MPQAPNTLVLSTGTPGNFAGFDAEGNLGDSGFAGPDAGGTWIDSGGVITGGDGSTNHADSQGTIGAGSSACHADSQGTSGPVPFGSGAHADSGGTALGQYSHANCQGNVSQGGDFASGSGARTYLPGQKAYANGSLVSAGDAQQTLTILSISDPNAGSQAELFVDGNNQTQRFVAPVGTCCAMVIDVLGFRADGQVVQQSIALVGWNSSGTMLINYQTPIVSQGQPWTITLAASNEFSAVPYLQVLVQGDGAGTPINWVAAIRSTETHF